MTRQRTRHPRHSTSGHPVIFSTDCSSKMLKLVLISALLVALVLPETDATRVRVRRIMKVRCRDLLSHGTGKVMLCHHTYGQYTYHGKRDSSDATSGEVEKLAVSEDDKPSSTRDVEQLLAL